VFVVKNNDAILLNTQRNAQKHSKEEERIASSKKDIIPLSFEREKGERQYYNIMHIIDFSNRNKGHGRATWNRFPPASP
jgi:hypothetical protein